FYNAQLSLEGPILGDRVTFFGLGRYFTNDGWLYGADLYNIDGSAGDSSLVPMNTFERISYQGNLKFRLSNSIIFNLSGLGQYSESRPYDFFRRWSPDGRTNSSNTGYNVKLKMTHLLSNRTFYTLNVATFLQEDESALYDSPFDENYNGFNVSPPDSIEVRPGVWESVVTGLRFARGGTDLGRFNRSTRSILIKGDLSSQLGDNHLVKTGFQFKVDDMDLRGFGLIPAVDENGNQIEPFAPAIPNDASSSITQFEGFNPLTISGYIQDKIEFENFIVNAGLRFDYFDSRAQVPADPTDPNIFNPLKKINRFRDTNGDGVIQVEEETSDNQRTIAEREEYWWNEADPKVQLSPRLGVAYPITEQGVVHFSYGIFFQIPTINRLSDNFGYKIPSSSGSYGPFGNPDLDAQKTTMYEIGFKQGFGDFVLDITGYYRDVRDWVSTSPPILTALPGINYVVYTNRDYANTRGITAAFSKGLNNLLGFDLSYTFQVVEGSNSNPADEFFASLGNQQPTLALLPLDWDQRHKVAGAFYTGEDDWGGSLRFRWEDGFPYTPTFLQAAQFGNDVQPEFPRNSRRLPPAFEIDVNLWKQFDLGTVRPKVFLEIFNVLDARNVTSVFSDTGEPDVTLQQLQTSNFDPGYWVRPSFYREPRRVQLGVEFKF
ncbi:MAG: TonB-dependent receptor, partial [Rhodothermales bacterium]|nr:TonB-dependent receptor [Rhodothermales bacterium]